jgi:magnesium chelatase family protein
MEIPRANAVARRALSSAICAKVSGPLLDRIDIRIEVPAVPYKELRGKGDGPTSEQVRERVEKALEVQRQRGFYNSQIPPSQIRQICAREGALGSNNGAPHS